MGIRVAMDDFGTGYSSLATLQTFTFDKNKIDCSFVKDLHLDRRRAAIVCSTLSLGDAFGIPVLTEGVETEDELIFLAAEGCEFVQGFYFGKPMSLSATRTLVMDQDMDTAPRLPFERRNCARIEREPYFQKCGD
jgi:EAL domain-containing protein (putative c-di-GMP-specific phosphodiesterase class I)